MTPLLAALSSLTNAARMACVVFSSSPASAASRNWRTEVFSADLTALLRWRAFSFCLLRLIWDLIFATRVPRSESGRVDRICPPRRDRGVAPGGTAEGMRAADGIEYPRSARLL